MPPASWVRERRLVLGNRSFRLGFLARAVVPRCDHIMNYLARSSKVRVTLQEKAMARCPLLRRLLGSKADLLRTGPIRRW